MGGRSSFRSMVLSLDKFREVPKDLTQPSMLGSLFTVLAYVLCASLFLFELNSFMTPVAVSKVLMDSNQDQELRIKFDISMHDLPCNHLSVGVWDSFGSERLNITANVQKFKLDHKGNVGGVYTEEEILALDKQTFTTEVKIGFYILF